MATKPDPNDEEVSAEGMHLQLSRREVKFGMKMTSVKVPEVMKKKFATGFDFIDMALGGVSYEDYSLGKAKGGMTPSEVLLLTGGPGIGKTTLGLQLADAVTKAGGVALVNSQEEGIEQLKMTVERLGLSDSGFYISNYKMMPKVIENAEFIRALHPDKQLFIFVDSLQSHNDGKYKDGGSTGMTLVRCMEQLVSYCKRDLEPPKKGEKRVSNIPPIGIVVGHATKDGKFAGKNQVPHTGDGHVHVWIDEKRTSATYGERLFNVKKHRFGPAGIFYILDLGKAGLKFKADISADPTKGLEKDDEDGDDAATEGGDEDKT